MPRDTLLALVTPSGYRRLKRNGRPGPTASPADFGGVLPLAAPAVFYVSGVARVAFVPARLVESAPGAMDTGLFVVEAADGTPVLAPGDKGPVALFDVLLADGETVPFGVSRSSPVFDRQGHVYVGT